MTHSLQLSSEESWCTVPYMVPTTSKLEADIEHHEANLMFLLIESFCLQENLHGNRRIYCIDDLDSSVTSAQMQTRFQGEP